MDAVKERRTVYDFKNTCQQCSNDIEFPLLGDFTYGEIIIQTKDGQDFYLAELINNRAYDFIIEHLTDDRDTRTQTIYLQKILTLTADRPHGKEFSESYPICPICKSKQENYSDNIRASMRELPFATWDQFEKLTEREKIEQIRRAVDQLT